MRVSINGWVGGASKKPLENAMTLRESRLSHHLKPTQIMLKRGGNNELIIYTKRGKTEVTLFGISKRLCKLNNPPLKIVNNFETINYTKSYKCLGLI